MAFVACVTTIFIVFANAWLASKSLPVFFQNVLGGFASVIPAALTYAAGVELGFFLPPSLVIASCIVALLAGLTLVQALQDGITGAPVTSSARFFETLLQTGGIIAGIGAGIQAMAWFGITLPPIDTSQTSGDFGSSPADHLGRFRHDFLLHRVLHRATRHHRGWAYRLGGIYRVLLHPVSGWLEPHVRQRYERAGRGLRRWSTFPSIHDSTPDHGCRRHHASATRSSALSRNELYAQFAVRGRYFQPCFSSSYRHNVGCWCGSG